MEDKRVTKLREIIKQVIKEEIFPSEKVSLPISPKEGSCLIQKYYTKKYGIGDTVPYDKPTKYDNIFLAVAALKKFKKETYDDDIMINLYMVTVEYDKKWTLIYRWFFTRHVEPSDFYKTYLTPEP